MNLVIVESPTKARTLQRFLEKNYIVHSTFGHVRDLPKNKLGVDIKNNFEPSYTILPKAKKQIAKIKRYIPKSEKIILATDEDREGEAIAWHLTRVISLKSMKSKIERIAFHEITKGAIKTALENPREIDMNLVNAQLARRILDRLVGYKLSPFLWHKVKWGLSAGRVQSVAVELICEREKEIKEFQPQEYWTIVALLSKLQKMEQKFEAILKKINGKVISKFEINTKKEADKIIKELDGAEYKVSKIKKEVRLRNPLPPFTTSLLQQEAWRKFYFPAKFTMQIAQNLYERGFITYHRTDSFNLSEQSLFLAKKIIEEKFGREYWAGYLRRYKTKAKATQEAHEAIRPTFPRRDIEKFKLKKEEKKLYDLIWRRFIACQMAAAKVEETKTEVIAQKGELKKAFEFLSEGLKIKFDGFLRVYPLVMREAILPELKENETLKLLNITPFQHWTSPPPRYNEATLIRALESYGIGRPSTYAPILSTIQKRNYIEKDKQKRFYPTEIGSLVNELLTLHFPEIINIDFTAEMEGNLDKIAKGEIPWQKLIEEFYFPFEKILRKKGKELKKEEIVEEKTNLSCPKCKKPLVIKIGKFGKFYACSGFPKCRFTKSYQAEEKGR